MNRNLIAILRGVHPDEVVEITSVIIEAGITKIEVPLNSPNPLVSIARMVAKFKDVAELGAGTVLSVEDVNSVADTGAGLIVSPNFDKQVIEMTKARGLKSYPGVLTPSECFAALNAGADGLKIFPASLIGVDGLKAIRAVLPVETQVYAVGGAGIDNFKEWIDAGVNGFGVGSALYKPGMSAADVGLKAAQMVQAYDEAMG